MWNTFFDFSFDFSMAFSLIKRALIYFVLILCMLSYCQAWRPFAEEFDKLLRALTNVYPHGYTPRNTRLKGERDKREEKWKLCKVKNKIGQSWAWIQRHHQVNFRALSSPMDTVTPPKVH